MMLADKIDIFLKLCDSTKAVQFEKDYYVIPDSFNNEVSASGIDSEVYGSQLRLNLRKYFGDCGIQFEEAAGKSIQHYSATDPVVWISTTGSCIYEPTTDLIVSKGNPDPDQQRIFRNTIAYLKFFEFLKAIADYWNSANTEFIFYNSVSGIIKIKFEPAPIIDFQGEITSELSQLQSLAGSPEITSVFVNAIFQLSMGTGEITLKQVIIDRKKVIDITKRDHELISKKFDFAKFRNSLYVEKEKYFKDIKEVVNKIFSQAIGIPISIGASVFTTYKIQGDNMVIGLVLVAFLGYMAFYLRLQWIYKQDLSEVGSQFEEDFAIIAADSGLPASTISGEKKKIENKISSVRLIQNWLIGLVIGLGILVSIFMVSQFGPKKIESPDPTIKELIEAIKKITSMNNVTQSDSAELANSPENFSIQVVLDNKTYEVNVTRYSFKGSSNEYWATIPTPDSILNKFPPVKYVVSNNDLVFKDSLAQILPGFAQKQKDALLDEFRKKKWKL